MQGDARNRFILYATVFYVVSALAWIFLSDRLLALFIDINSIIMLSTAKGVFFVFATSVVFYFVLHAVPPDSQLYASSLLSSLEDGSRRLHRPGWLVYGFSFGITFGMLYLHSRIALGAHSHPNLILFIFPIVLSAILGGFWAGLLSTLLATFGVLYLSFSADFPNSAHDPLALVRWLSLLVSGGAISIMSELLKRSLLKDENQRRLLLSVVSSTTDAVFVKDIQGRYLLANQSTSNILGRPVDEILTHTDAELFSVNDAKLLMERDAAIMLGSKVNTSEEILHIGSEKEMVYLVTKGPVFDERGVVCGLFGIARDITERKQDELRLIQSERKLQEAQQIAILGNWEWDVISDQHFWSSQIYVIYGRDPDTRPAAYPEVAQYFTRLGWEGISTAVNNCLQDGLPYTCDVEIIREDGVHRWIVARGQALRDMTGKVCKLYGTLQDITERKAVEIQLQINEERLQLATDAACDAMWDWDLNTGKVYRSPNYYAITNKKPEEDNHDFAFFRSTIHPNDLSFVLAAIDAHIRGETDSIEFEYRLANNTNDASRKTRWMRTKGRTVARDELGRPLRILGTLTDITERHRVNEDLRTVLQEAGDAIWITDEGGRYTFANPSACTLTGYTEQEICRLSIPDLIAEEAKSLIAPHLRLLESEKYIRMNWPILRKDGSVVQVDLSTERLEDGRYMAFGRDLTEEQLAQAALKQREQQLARVIEGADQGYWDWNLRTNEFVVSARWETMLGYQAGEMHVTPDCWPDLVHPDDLPKALESIRQHLAGETASHEIELRCRTKSGDWCWILTRGRVVEWGADGKPLMMSGTHTDITEKKQFEHAQKDALTVFSSSYEGIMVVGVTGHIMKVNPAFTRITGYSAKEVIGNSPKILSSGQHDTSFYRQLWQDVNKNDFWCGEIWNRRKSGEIYAELLSISAVRDEQSNVLHYIGVFSDISQIKAHEAELERIAHYDVLTGTPNRRLLGDRLEQAILRSVRNDTSLAVCFLDLDGFKSVNDRYGHRVGDRLLVGVTENMRHVLRGNDTLARLGGDEFVLLLCDIDTVEECEQILERILHSVSSPIQFEEIILSVTASVGVCLFPEDRVDADSLLRHADQAMYIAKNAGKNCYHLFDPENDRKAQVHRNFLELLTLAMRQEEFVLYYQPKVDLRDGRVIGAEALIRWNHPERGILAPIEFLSHIHGSHLEQKLGEWVIRTALRQGELWHQQGVTARISVNVSADHLLQSDFYSHLEQALKLHPLMPADDFELEVLETAAIADIDHAVSLLQRCRQLGVHFALDDFGTGYSSLTYLRKLPVDTLKIDQSFVRTMLDDSDDLGIVEGVIRLAGAFNREVIAEGVETLEHGSVLLKLGCHLAQGYGIARPMPADAFLPWIEKWQSERTWVNL